MNKITSIGSSGNPQNENPVIRVGVGERGGVPGRRKRKAQIAQRPRKAARELFLEDLKAELLWKNIEK